MMKTLANHYTIGEFAQKSGITLRTLRYYDKIDLLKPITHNSIGHRLYDDSDFEKLQKIMTLKFVGFSLNDIRKMMESSEISIKDTLKMQKKILEEKKKHLDMVIDAIEETSNMLEKNQNFEWEKFINIIKIINLEKAWIDESGNAFKQYKRIKVHDTFSINLYGWRHWLFDQLSIKTGDSILEVGCGDGGLWARNLERLQQDTKIILTDFSNDMIDNAKTNLGCEAASFHFQLADVQWLPFENNSFDHVIADHMLYYVKEPEKALAEIYRVLKPGGTLYVSTTGNNHLQELKQLLTDFNKSLVLSGFSLKKFNLDQGKAMLERWFSDIEIRTYQDALVITEVEPLLEYILSASGNLADILVGDVIDEFRNYLKNSITSHGSLYFTKNIGLFVATKE